MDCQYIKDRGNYFSATRPTGDNKNSVIVYKDSLVSHCHTAGFKGDIITLVEEFQNLYFTKALYWICKLLNIDYYYQEKEDKELITDWEWINKLLGKATDKKELLKPLPESVLLEYLKHPHKLFLDDNIDIPTQEKFEIGYSLRDERIIIPIRDEIGTLIGVKGRTTRPEEVEAGYKYMPLYKYPTGEILYGLDKTLEHIKERNEVVIVESEKGCLQLWSMGLKNGIGAAGHYLSETQLIKLIRLNVPVVIAFDKVSKEKIDLYDDMKKSIKKAVKELRQYTQVSIIWDTENVLDDKQSPTDDPSKWEYLYDKKIIVK